MATLSINKFKQRLNFGILDDAKHDRNMDFYKIINNLDV